MLGETGLANDDWSTRRDSDFPPVLARSLAFTQTV